MSADYLIFSLAGRTFGADLASAVEIVPWMATKRVPLAYSYVEGLLDYRGRICPVFNLEKRLELKPLGPIGFIKTDSPSGRQAAGSLLLLDEKGTRFGIGVDAVLRMARIEMAAEPPPRSAVQGIEPQFISHIVPSEDGDIIILDFERLLFHAG